MQFSDSEDEEEQKKNRTSVTSRTSLSSEILGQSTVVTKQTSSSTVTKTVTSTTVEVSEKDSGEIMEESKQQREDKPDATSSTKRVVQNDLPTPVRRSSRSQSNASSGVSESFSSKRTSRSNVLAQEEKEDVVSETATAAKRVSRSMASTDEEEPTTEASKTTTQRASRSSVVAEREPSKERGSEPIKEGEVESKPATKRVSRSKVVVEEEEPKTKRVSRSSAAAEEVSEDAMKEQPSKEASKPTTKRVSHSKVAVEEDEPKTKRVSRSSSVAEEVSEDAMKEQPSKEASKPATKRVSRSKVAVEEPSKPTSKQTNQGQVDATDEREASESVEAVTRTRTRVVVDSDEEDEEKDTGGRASRSSNVSATTVERSNVIESRRSSKSDSSVLDGETNDEVWSEKTPPKQQMLPDWSVVVSPGQHSYADYAKPQKETSPSRRLSRMVQEDEDETENTDPPVRLSPAELVKTMPRSNRKKVSRRSELADVPEDAPIAAASKKIGEQIEMIAEETEESPAPAKKRTPDPTQRHP